MPAFFEIGVQKERKKDKEERPEQNMHVADCLGRSSTDNMKSHVYDQI